MNNIDYGYIYIGSVLLFVTWLAGIEIGFIHSILNTVGSIVVAVITTMLIIFIDKVYKHSSNEN